MIVVRMRVIRYESGMVSNWYESGMASEWYERGTV